ncbi:MAG: acetylornithine deacetylase/succinyl-diaminopimelate desuccinylase-like protein [Paracoccaceae bacterium]|jgi:acetylornithine deacetylase/succinyl-diaminopimelate desuccinylase-like protein
MDSARRFGESRLTAMGLRNVRRLKARGEPAIFAQSCAAPGGPWRSEPSEATAVDGRLCRRGAADDEGPMLIAPADIEAVLAVEGQLPVTLKILIEGEEETGGPTMPALLARHGDLLASDATLSADGGRWREGLVRINTGSRGSGGLEICARTAHKDLHSGRYGGGAPNALHVLARLIAALNDAGARIAAPGIYEGATEPTAAARAALAAIPVDTDAPVNDLGAIPAGKAGWTTHERRWLRPAIDVNGMWGDHVGAGRKTVIAHEAFAEITVRLAHGQNPDHAKAALLAHLPMQTLAGATLTPTGDRGWGAAYAVPPAHPLLLAAENALHDSTGKAPMRVRIRASLPLTNQIRDALGIDAVMFSYSISDEEYHAANEFMRLSALDDGLAGWVAILRRIGAHTAADYALYRGLRANPAAPARPPYAHAPSAPLRAPPCATERPIAGPRRGRDVLSLGIRPQDGYNTRDLRPPGRAKRKRERHP